ncbi:MAG: hypothetical protein N2690_02190 [Rhodocyclaceae bacterium]|nr:hypothetical protein [Rhodocyclaceae bacterium]
MTKKIPWLLIVCVVLPLLAAVIYLATASSLYRSSASFVVRSADGASQASLPMLVRAMAPSGGLDAAAIVRDYLVSEEVMSSLDAQHGLRSHYAAADWMQRFPRPWDRPTLQRFFEYFAARQAVALDAQSSVLTIKVDAFAPEVARNVAQSLIEMAHQRVAALNEQIRRDTLGLAQQELQRARQRLDETLAALARYRLKHNLMDPERQAWLDLQMQHEAQLRLAAARSRLQHAKQVAPESPATEALAAEVATLQALASQAGGRVAADQKTSRAALADEFARLMLEREVASKALAAAEEAFVKANAEMQRRHLYVEVLSAPTLPDDAMAPRAARVVAAVLFFGLLTWASLWLLGVGVREHAAARP